MPRPTRGSPPTPAPAQGSTRWVRKVALAALGTAIAAALLWFGANTHLQRACVLLDTPYLPLCPATPESDAARQQALRDRLRDNPGDSGAWLELAGIESPANHDALLRAVEALAPNDPNSLRLRARQALAENQLPLAVDLLVKMTEHRLGGEEPPQLLARLLAGEGGVALLRPHLAAGNQWLPRVLTSLASLKLPLEPGLPLLAEAAAQGIVPPTVVQSFVRSLKAGGRWADAYALWLAQHRQSVSTLFNGSFENRFQPDGFDWEPAPAPPGRAGALVSQRNTTGHGQVLEVLYTGRAVPAPVIRQYLFVAPGRYTLQGQYMASKLRTEQGLAWSVRCTDGSKALAGRSNPLQDTNGIWQRFRFEFAIPASCGMVASLQLETFAPYEAAVGLRGTAAFDDFELRSPGG